MKSLYLLVILFSCQLILAQQSSLKIEISNINNQKGNIMIGLYKSANNFPKKEAFLTVFLKPTANQLNYTFTHLEKGVYAVAVLHDENENKKMDIGVFGPKEAYAFSNNAKGFFGPPKFEKCTFYLDGKNNKTISVKLN